MQSDDIKTDTFAEHVRQQLVLLGEDPNREGLRKTPERVAKSWNYFTSGYRADIDEAVNGAIFEEVFKGCLLCKDCDIYSTCEHHKLPFMGRAHVAYIANGKVIGLSKIPRICDIFARRLQIQERLTQQIGDTLFQLVQPAAVAVLIQATHCCVQCRGVQKANASTITTYYLGAYETDPALRMEFLTLVGMK